MITLYIKSLVVEGRHGLHEQEKTNPQKFKIAVELEFDTVATMTDNLNDTHDWSSLRDQIIHTVQSNSFNLIERLAAEIAHKLMENKSIKKCTVSIDKLEAFENGTPGIRLEILS